MIIYEVHPAGKKFNELEEDVQNGKSVSPRGEDVPRLHDHVRLYANLLATLEKSIDGARLGELFTHLRASGESRQLPVEADTEVPRMLLRLGLVGASQTPTVRAKRAEDIIRETAEQVGRTPAQVSLVFRLFAAGMYGIMPRPVCGATPLCRECRLTKECEYYNSPPKRPASENIPPAKRLVREGAGAVSDIEVISLLLGGKACRKTHVELARMLLERFGSLRGIAMTTYTELVSLRGVSEGAGLRLAAVSAYLQRAAAEKRASGPAVRSGKDFYDLYHQSYRDLKKEIFTVVLLDQKNRVMKDVRVSEGTLTASLVHPREVFRPAIREAAAAVAFVHNHPSGDSTPSPEDKAITKRLCETADLVGIRVLDHVIIGEDTYTSFVDKGLM